VRVSGPAGAIHSGEAARLADVPLLPVAEFRRWATEGVASGAGLAALFGNPLEGGVLRLFAVLLHRDRGAIEMATADVQESYPALTPDCPQASLFEREIAEEWGVVPAGHPWLKPVRFHRSRHAGRDAWGRGPEDEVLPGVTSFFAVEGPAVHEVAVGPIHAGVIEPGHFRFQCHGEQVLNLEIALGYQHRGVERALVGGPDKRTLHYMETLAGDTSVGHATAYCQAVEALARCEVPRRALALRGIALELERLANHAGDLGALAQDVGFLPTASFCGRIRGDFLNMTAAVCGSRFGRGWVRPGGAGFDIEPPLRRSLLERLDAAMRDAQGAVRLLWETSSVRGRFENTGPLSRETCLQLGAVGPVARASGVRLDVRRDFPAGLYRDVAIPISVCEEGDVYARAMVRWLEMQASGEFVRGQLQGLGAAPFEAASREKGPREKGPREAGPLAPGRARANAGELAPESIAVSLVEGWRGEICHVAITDSRGAFSCYKVVDPSFHNWAGLAMALRDQQISDFPLCNKSFNLSYCGHDL